MMRSMSLALALAAAAFGAVDGTVQNLTTGAPQSNAVVTLMDLGAGMVDVLRFGEGAAESYETGSIAPLLQDVLRGVSIASQSGTALQRARPLIGKLKLYSDPGGGLCVPMSIGNALQRTGQRFLSN